MTLFRPVTPLPDENLAGLVARAAGANIYPHARDVLDLAGLDTPRPGTIVSRHPDHGIELASVLGTSVDLLRPLFQPDLGGSQIDFFGTNLRAVHRETRLRRVSPRALADKAYVRAIWSLRPLSFDPSTRETLISQCPVCDGKLGFTKTWGVEFCEHCIGADEDGLPAPMVDLRDFPQPLVEVDDEEGLDFVTGLIDPSCREREYSLHDALTGMSRGDLFEMALAMASAFAAEEQRIPAVPEARNRPQTEPLPKGIAAAGRILLEWPTGFDALTRRLAQTADQRSGRHGIYKEFGGIAQLQRDLQLHEKAWAAISERLYAAMSEVKPNENVVRKTTRPLPPGAYIGVRQLLREVPASSLITTRMGAHPSMYIHRPSDDPMAPVMFKTWQAVRVLRHFQNLTSEGSLSAALGLPPDAIRDLVDTGFIDDYKTSVRRIADDLRGEEVHYRKDEAEEFVDMILHGPQFMKRPKGFISFSEAMLMFPAGRRPWLPVIMSILFQRVDAIYHRNVLAQAKPKNLFGAMSVNAHQMEQQRNRILDEHKDTKLYDLGRVPAIAAIMSLGLYNHHVFMALDEAELIDVNDDGADYQSVLAFADQYIFSNEAAVRSRNSGMIVRKWLAARGLQPEFDFRIKGGLVYSREKVEPWLEMEA